jgi:hypothetical protein
MKSELYYGKPIGIKYDDLLSILAGKSVHSVKTSSVPLVQFWKTKSNEVSGTKVERIFKTLGLAKDEVSLCFEYPVPPQKGTGKASMTDLMILSGDSKIAIEAKYTEYTRGNSEDVASWLNSGNKKNRQAVLDGWWEMIAPFRQPGSERSNEIEYQFLHRTASACYENTGKAIVVYQVFYDEETKPALDDYRERLLQWMRKIAPSERLGFYTWEIETFLQVNNDIETEENPFLQMRNKTDVYTFGKDTIIPFIHID